MKDWDTLKAIFTGKKVELDTSALPHFPSGTAILNFILIVLLAFGCGAYVSAHYYSVQCNNHILETFYPEALENPALLEYGAVLVPFNVSPRVTIPPDGPDN